MSGDEVSPPDVVLRRIHPAHIVSDPKAHNGKRASSAAFQDDRDGSSMSVYVRSKITALNLTDSDVLVGKGEDWAIAASDVELLHKEEQLVKLDPLKNESSPHPCDPAHALVIGNKEPKSRRDRIAQQSPLIFQES